MTDTNNTSSEQDRDSSVRLEKQPTQAELYEKLFPGEIEAGKIRLLLVQASGIVLKLALVIISFSLYFFKAGSFGGDQYGIPYYLIALAILILFVKESIGYIQLDEIGFRTNFGKLLDMKMGEGLYYSPYLLVKMFRFPREVLQIQYPGEPEDVQKTSDNEPLRVAEIRVGEKLLARTRVRPVRITTHEDNKSDDPLSARLTGMAAWIVRFRIEEPAFFVREFSGSFDEIIKQLRDLGETILGEQVSKRTAAQLVDELPDINAGLHARHEKTVQRGLVDIRRELGKNSEGVEQYTTEEIQRHPWGIRIDAADFIPFDTGKSTAEQLQKVVAAKAEARATVTTADADAYQRVQEGKSEGKKREDIAAGEGRGLKRQAKSLDIEPREALAAKVAGETVGESDLILGTEGLTQAIGIGKTLLEKLGDPRVNTDTGTGSERSSE